MRYSGNLFKGKSAHNAHLDGVVADMAGVPDNYPGLASWLSVPKACFMKAAWTSLEQHDFQSSVKTVCPFDGSPGELVGHCNTKTSCRGDFVRHWFHSAKAQRRIELRAGLLSLDRMSAISNHAKFSEEEVQAFVTALDSWSFTYKAERRSRALQVHFGGQYFQLGNYAAAFVAENHGAPATETNNHGAAFVPLFAADPLLFHIVRILPAVIGDPTVWEVKSLQDHTEERWVMKERLYRLPVWHGTVRTGKTCWEQHEAWKATNRHRVKASDGKPLEPAMRIFNDLDIVPTDYTPTVPGKIAQAIVHDVACPINASSS
jgi:hypothetical protein